MFQCSHVYIIHNFVNVNIHEDTSGERIFFTAGNTAFVPYRGLYFYTIYRTSFADLFKKRNLDNVLGKMRWSGRRQGVLHTFGYGRCQVSWNDVLFMYYVLGCATDHRSSMQFFIFLNLYCSSRYKLVYFFTNIHFLFSVINVNNL